MKIIKVSTDLKIEECDFLEMNYQEQLKMCFLWSRMGRLQNTSSRWKHLVMKK